MKKELCELIEVIEEIVGALHREMGTGWCISTINKLNKIKQKIDTKADIVMKLVKQINKDKNITHE